MRVDVAGGPRADVVLGEAEAQLTGGLDDPAVVEVQHEGTVARCRGDLHECARCAGQPALELSQGAFDLAETGAGIEQLLERAVRS